MKNPEQTVGNMADKLKLLSSAPSMNKAIRMSRQCFNPGEEKG